MAISLEFLTEQLALADQLLAGRETMLEPQDLPGRYGRAVQAVNRLLQIMGCEAVLAGGWAVWRHGFVGRITQDIDIVLPADRVEEFLQVASVAGFEILPQPEGRWPKVRYKDADVKVDILPEGGRPGVPSKLAPTVIPHPRRLGGVSGDLRYIALPALIELKIAAGRGRDDSDVIELLRTNPDQVDAIRAHLATVHPDYVLAFDRLLERAREQRDE
jgi:aminoglycoside-2''-adenylyltransferase